ncbi:hypothetical protein COOONC_07116 [Cooperia oncophora]
MHPKSRIISPKSNGWLAPRRKTTKLSVHPRKNMLLESGNWGECSRGNGSMVTYERASCEQDCIVEQLTRRCGCAPFFDEKSYIRSCGLVELYRCSRQERSWKKCECPIECDRMDYSRTKITYLNKKQTFSNYSTIDISIRSRRIQTDEQMKRIKAVDLLSYVAGSMGLFLGMSCVTLLEVFIYLFKSVWGVFNDQRHKSYYLENFLGDDGDEENDVPDEEIVIKTRSDMAGVHQPVAFDAVDHESPAPSHHDHFRSRVKIQIVHHPFERRRSSFAIH